MIRSFETEDLPKMLLQTVKNGSLTSTVERVLHTAPAYGNGQLGTRTTDSIMVRKINHRMVLYGGDNQNVIRIIAIQMKANVLPIATDFLFNGPSAAVDILSIINPYNEKQFHLLFDRTIALNLSGSNGTVCLNFSIVPKIKNWNYYFQSGNLNSGQILYFMVSDSDVVPSPVVEWNCLTEFDDSK